MQIKRLAYSPDGQRLLVVYKVGDGRQIESDRFKRLAVPKVASSRPNRIVGWAAEENLKNRPFRGHVRHQPLIEGSRAGGGLWQKCLLIVPFQALGSQAHA